MLTSGQFAFLERIFPGDALVRAPEALAAYGCDAGRRPGLPWAAVLPETLEQVVELLTWAQAERIPLIPRARGTNRTSATAPWLPERSGQRDRSEGGLIVSCLRMNRVLDVDPGDFVAVVQPGVVNADLKAAASAKGLFYPPDPASFRYSTVGGNVATNAGGMNAVKYGVTRDHLLGLEAVLPGGRVVRLGGRVHKNATGLNALGLFAGAEGTLGFVTELTMKLLPKPEASASLLAAFPDTDAALAAAGRIFASGRLPAALEFFCDRTVQALAAAGVDAPWTAGTGAGAALLCAFDGGAESVRADVERLSDGLAGGEVFTAVTPEAEDALWEVRRAVSQATFALAPDKLSDDVTVPRSKIGALVRGRREIEARFGLPIVSFGHLGDGNLHVGVLFDSSVPGRREQAEAARLAVSDLALSLGGTLSGEHGVGMSKLSRLDRQYGPETLELFARIKAAFDPLGIMNPGKAVPEAR